MQTILPAFRPSFSKAFLLLLVFVLGLLIAFVLTKGSSPVAPLPPPPA
jgi:hypothetical protein